MSGSLFHYALCKKTKYKQGMSHSGKCEKQFSIAALWHAQCYAIRHWCFSVLTGPASPLAVCSVSAEGTLPHLTPASSSPQIPAKLRSLSSSMVCYWFRLTFCCLLMQTKRWQKYWIASLVITQTLFFDLLSSVSAASSILLKCHLRPWLFTESNQKSHHQLCSPRAPSTVIHFLPQASRKAKMQFLLKCA